MPKKAYITCYSRDSAWSFVDRFRVAELLRGIRAGSKPYVARPFYEDGVRCYRIGDIGIREYSEGTDPGAPMEWIPGCGFDEHGNDTHAQ